MIDHIVTFADEAAAKADPVIGAYFVEDPEAEGGGNWRGDQVIPSLFVYRLLGSEIITPPEGEPYEQEVRDQFPDWFLLVALPELSPAIRDLPDNGCFLIADRNAAAAGEDDFILYQSPLLSDPVRQMTRASPIFAGADYPFHTGVLRG